MESSQGGKQHVSAHRYPGFILTLIFIFYAAALLVVKNPPAFVDYPDWVYQGVLFKHVLAHQPVAGYALKTYPVPNALTTLGIGLLNCLMPWQWAGKIWICIYLGLASFASFRLARILRVRNRWILLALPGTVFLNLNFWYGHINFEFGICVLLIFASMLFESENYRAAYAWMLVLLFFIHMEACACAVLLFMCFCFERKRKKLLWLTTPVLLLTVWYVLGRFSSGNVDGYAAMTSQYRYASLQFAIFKIGTYFKTLGYVNVLSSSGFSRTEAIFGKPLMMFFIALSLLLGLILLVIFVRSAVQSIRSRTNTRFAWIFVVSLLLISMLLPQTMLGTSDPGSRLILAAVAIALFLVSVDRTPLLPIVVALSLTLCIANFWQFCDVQARPAAAVIHEDGLSSAVRKYAHVEPETRLEFYRKLESGTMDQRIFPTALFRDMTMRD